jgi:hypothetical protein
MDILREREHRRRTEAGQDEFEAWAAVATDAKIGLRKWRGLASIPVEAVVRTYGLFVARVAPAEVGAARLRVERFMSRTAQRNAETVQAVADGKIACGDEAKCRLAGAREALKIVGIGADKQTRVGLALGVNVANVFEARTTGA